MTYITGGAIQALDYNTFGSLAESISEVFGDLHPGATTLAGGADYGYGQVPAPSTVAIGNPVLATEWQLLYQSIRKCGQHQGVQVSPPLPGTPPGFNIGSTGDSNQVSSQLPGQIINAYNSPTTLASLIETLRASRLNLTVAQSVLVTDIGGTSSYVQPGSTSPWVDSLTFTFRVSFASWDTARYFFNSGGSILITGEYELPVSPEPEDISWHNLLNNISPLKFSSLGCAPASGSGNQNRGIYQLSENFDANSIIYQRALGGAYYYSGSEIVVRARYVDPAGTSGDIEFEVMLASSDSTPKAGISTFTIGSITSTGAIVFPGPAPTVNTEGGDDGYISI